MTRKWSSWDVRAGTAPHTREDMKLGITIPFGPSGRTLASASVDQTVKLWDSNSGDLIITL